MFKCLLCVPIPLRGDLKFSVCLFKSQAALLVFLQAFCYKITPTEGPCQDPQICGTL